MHLNGSKHEQMNHFNLSQGSIGAFLDWLVWGSAEIELYLCTIRLQGLYRVFLGTKFAVTC